MLKNIISYQWWYFCRQNNHFVSSMIFLWQKVLYHFDWPNQLSANTALNLGGRASVLWIPALSTLYILSLIKKGLKKKCQDWILISLTSSEQLHLNPGVLSTRRNDKKQKEVQTVNEILVEKHAKTCFAFLFIVYWLLITSTNNWKTIFKK